MTLIKKLTLAALLVMMVTLPSFGQAKDKLPKKVMAKSVRSGVPDGYVQLGTTDIFYSQTEESIDFIGRFDSSYYSSTFADGGYELAIKVGTDDPMNVDCLNGITVDNVLCSVSVVPQGDLGRVIYTVTNTSNEDVTVSLGTHADVMIGENDSAPISRRIDTMGNTYGLTMKDGGGAQLCVLFGSGLVGVNAVSDYWFGFYSLNRDTSAMVGNYSSGSNYMVEDGSYDSGMGWCWKDRTIPAYSSVEFSYLIGVGEVNLEPNSTFEVTPDDPDGWNDLSRPHLLTLDGEYESPAGQNGKIEYAVEDSEEWIALTEELESGSNFVATLVAVFNPELPTHTIHFRTVDAVGNTSLLTPIVYKDVSFQEIQGIENKVYNWGDSITQTSLTCDLMSDQYEITNYRNNVNAGIATFNIEGVFPYTIGRKTYSFNIEQLALTGEMEFTEGDSYVYTGNSFTPEWIFTDNRQNDLVSGQDYSIEWSDNIYPGTATLRVEGINNFIGSIQKSFHIDKAQLQEDLYTLILPDEDVTFDSVPHGATSTKSEGVGEISILYGLSDMNDLTTEAPCEVGKYDVYVEISDGDFYYGIPQTKIASFTIYQFDEADWVTIQTVVPSLTQRGWETPWDLSAGITCASTLDGLTIQEGRVVGLNLSDQGLSGDFPTELLSFSALKTINISKNKFNGALELIQAIAIQAPELFATVENIDISENEFSGNIGAFAAAFPILAFLDASKNHISDVYPMISSNVATLNLKGQTLDNIVDIDLSNLSVESLVQQIPTLLIYNHSAQSYNKQLRLRCTADDGWSVVIVYENGKVNFEDVSDQNAYYGKSGDLLGVKAMSADGQIVEASLSMRLYFVTGDSNFDGDVSVLDLQAIILYAFDAYYGYPFNFTASDLYSDNQINVQDVICMANILLANSMETQESRISKLAPIHYESNEGACVYIEGNKLYINSDCRVAAIDILIDGNAEWNLEKYGLKTVSTSNHLVGYSLTDLILPAGIVEIGEVSGNSRVVKCVLSDQMAQPIQVSVGNNSSGIESIENSTDNKTRIYDISGRRQDRLFNGVNVVIDGNEVKKILNRK